jgi:mannose-6-phosphate isomerase-like protein (cupin superfamily)
MATPIEATYKKDLQIEHRDGFSWLQAGKFAELHDYEIYNPKQKATRSGKLFLRDPLKLTGTQISLTKLPAGESVPFFHKHRQNEEVYIFVGGTGQMQLNDEVFEVREGTVARVDPATARIWRNNGTEDLYCVVIQARANSLEQETFDDGEGCPDRQVDWKD